MTKTTRKQNAERKARMDAITLALADEFVRFNAAIEAGAVVMLPTFNGPKKVGFISAGFNAHCPLDNGGFGFTYSLCNDHRWSDLMLQAGCKRNLLFAQYELIKS